MPKQDLEIKVKASDAASKTLQGISGRIQGMSKQMRMAGVGMMAAGAAIVGGLAVSIKAFAKAGDEVHKMGLRMAFATESLSEYKHALEISGASLNDLEKAVKRMSKTIVDASEGMATYIRSFDRIGLKVEELMGLEPEKQFERIAMAIADLEDPTLRAATAQDIFGRAGTQLLPLLAAGRDGIKELREEAHKLGIVFDQEAAAKAAELTDAMHRVEEATKGLQFALAEALVPTLIPLVEKVSETVSKFTEWAKANPELIQGLAKLGLALGAGGALLVGMSMFGTAIRAATTAMRALRVATLFMTTTPIGLLLAGLGMLALGFYLLNESQQKQLSTTRAEIEATEKHAEAMEKLGSTSAIAMELRQEKLAELNKALIVEKMVLMDTREQAMMNLKVTKETTEAIEGQIDATWRLMNLQNRMGRKTGYAAAWALGTWTEAGWKRALEKGAGYAFEYAKSHATSERRSALMAGAGAVRYQKGGYVTEPGIVEPGEYVIPKTGRAPFQPIIQIFFDGEEMERTYSRRVVEKVILQGGL